MVDSSMLPASVSSFRVSIRRPLALVRVPLGPLRPSHGPCPAQTVLSKNRVVSENLNDKNKCTGARTGGGCYLDLLLVAVFGGSVGAGGIHASFRRRCDGALVSALERESTAVALRLYLAGGPHGATPPSAPSAPPFNRGWRRGRGKRGRGRRVPHATVGDDGV